MQYGKRIRQLREQQKPKMSQAKLASAIGVTQQAISAFEKGATKGLSFGMAQGLAKVFGLSMDELFPVDKRSNPAA